MQTPGKHKKRAERKKEKYKPKKKRKKNYIDNYLEIEISSNHIACVACEE